jgi:hypothetical protein
MHLLRKDLVIHILVAWAIIALMPNGGSAASKRYGLDRCAYANCFHRELSRSLPERRGYIYKPHHKIKIEEATPVGRLQNTIGKQQTERKTAAGAFQRPAILQLQGPSGLSCRRGRRLLQGQGYYRVSPFECRGRMFTYFARRDGKVVRILVDSRNGRIISTH